MACLPCALIANPGRRRRRSSRRSRASGKAPTFPLVILGLGVAAWMILPKLAMSMKGLGYESAAMGEPQKEMLVHAGLQQGLITITKCNTYNEGSHDSSYRPCEFRGSNGDTLNFEQAADYVYQNRY